MHIIDTLTFDADRRLVFFEDRSALVYDVTLTVRDDDGKKILRLGVGEDVYFIRCSSDDNGDIRKSNKAIEKLEAKYLQIRSMPPLPPEPEPVQEKEIGKVSDWIDLSAIDIDEDRGIIRIGEASYPANMVRVVLTTAFERKALDITTPDAHYTAYSAAAKISSVLDNGSRVNALSWKADKAAKRAARLQLLEALRAGKFPDVAVPEQVKLGFLEKAVIVDTYVSLREPQMESASDINKPLGIFRTIGETILPDKVGSKSRESMKTVDTGILVLTNKRIIFTGPVRHRELQLSNIPRPILDEKQMTVLVDQTPVTFSDIDGESWNAALSALLD